MSRAATVLALALAALEALGAAVRPASGAAAPVSRLVSPDLFASPGGDSVWVYRDPSPRAVLAAPDVARKLGELLLRSERVNTADAAPEVCPGCPGQLTVVLVGGFPALNTRVDGLRIVLAFREALALYSRGAIRIGWSSFRDDGPLLLALVKRALPADSAVQLHEWEPTDDEHAYVDELPKVLVRRAPEYPEAAKRARIEGTVIVRAMVDTSGRVVGTSVIRSIPMLDDAAARAVLEWTFKPATRNGVPVQVRVAVPVKFTLH